MWQEFKAFLIKDNVIGLAIAVIIGLTLNKLVTSVVDDIVMPLIAQILPAGGWQQWAITLPREGTAIKIGNFFAALLNFFVIGFVCWRITKIFVKPAPAK